MNYNHILQKIHKKIGAPPRKFNLFERLTWFKQDKPDWDWENDDIRISVENWEKAFRNGRLTWGHIIQVNTLLFEKSDANCPGEVLLWTDQSKPFAPEHFELVADRLFEMKGYSAHIDETDEKEFAAHLENELTRAYGIKVPERIANGIALSVSTVFFQRRHIPGGKITDSLFPVLYLESPPMATVMVPYQCWPKEFLDAWMEE